MIIKRKVGPKGQIVIPKDARAMLHIEPGTEVLIEILENEIRIRPAIKGQEFFENFIKTPKKLKNKIDFKKQLDEQYK